NPTTMGLVFAEAGSVGPDAAGAGEASDSFLLHPPNARTARTVKRARMKDRGNGSRTRGTMSRGSTRRLFRPGYARMNGGEVSDDRSMTRRRNCAYGTRKLTRNSSDGVHRAIVLKVDLSLLDGFE